MIIKSSLKKLRTYWQDIQSFDTKHTYDMVAIGGLPTQEQAILDLEKHYPKHEIVATYTGETFVFVIKYL